MNVTMCLRRKWQAISSEPCKAHVRHLAAAAFSNALLDAPLLRACAANITQHCMEPSAALVCLKGLLANGLQLAPGCTAVLQERLLEAAGEITLVLVAVVVSGCAAAAGWTTVTGQLLLRHGILCMLSACIHVCRLGVYCSDA
jgi:hypothetical protein